MLGVFFFLLLLPLFLYLLSKFFYDEEDPKVVFLKTWMYRNLYYFGILLGAFCKFMIPGTSPEDIESTEKPNVENTILKGIKKVWKS